ncbi:Selenoprotein K [Microtus ochrogaster]|uniref:Selenoprotein K n=1 Tax=Microtus ochrogaster TaxID=79684 RepID=A0A8J6GM29_MICOH|nr:Selenoprotein K [Microtus ochrogaster]
MKQQHHGSRIPTSPQVAAQNRDIPMAFGGQVLDSRNQSPWRLSFITDFFWGIAEFVVFFFKTLLQQDVKKRRGYGSSSGSRYDDGRGCVWPLLLMSVSLF